MGLDVSHDAWEGAYSAFNRFRQAVCHAAGGSFPYHTDAARLDELGVSQPDPNWWYVPDGVTAKTHPGLYLFLAHSDCDGIITPEECVKVADDLEKLLPELDKMGPGGGHLDRVGGFGGAARKFIGGCRLAAERGEDLEFH